MLTDNLYNDLGFIARDRLLILVEAQSTWTVNILVRALLYLAQSWHEYFQRTSQDYHKSRKVKMPKPELYVIFTGSKSPTKYPCPGNFSKARTLTLKQKQKSSMKAAGMTSSASTLRSAKCSTSRRSGMG